MIENSVNNFESRPKEGGTDPVSIGNYLDAERIEIGITVSSKKRLLEEITALLIKGREDLDRKTIIRLLNERERLGSTAIGAGIALPHGRVNGLNFAIGGLLILNHPLQFDAPDGVPVDLVVGLLVPAEATREHVEILGQLTRVLNRPTVREQLLQAEDGKEVLSILISSS
ncbi:MAG: hypothetical protein CL388_00460 [Acidiferrobacteraceae bacterium]|jgi:PTS system nitrogen regulatory IIA component|nr:hypothetical protein [Acidiferrobacteraceae bacterium]MDP6123187.1 PTS sugar transporter subunit IIA [Arenicellales bacterium]MDP6434988.1 PTS sugar transporter subunit IIA [Arenicellales bacterium]MDP6672558.1 PTS sugar transporter subunit IIA [Arenicellales bacterium]MDP6725002.1 PTS sugar transporter subunit IIA [Arenicellales bacterium]|tara:strand:- start:5433 stop:5945 length:513 start_codon:yes stop_codon:yes gene_type:complete